MTRDWQQTCDVVVSQYLTRDEVNFSLSFDSQYDKTSQGWNAIFRGPLLERLPYHC